MPTAPENLKRRLVLAYEIQVPEERDLAEIIYRQRQAAYRLEIESMAQALGVSRRAIGPNGEDAAVLMQMSRDDAKSIRRTFNRDLEREIDRLYTANPEGKRQYYIDNLGRWADARAEWKDRQIALYNDKTARHYAQQRFNAMNRVKGATYRFVGPAPVCDDCAWKFMMGIVDQAYVDENPSPRHVNCSHTWQVVGAKAPEVALSQLWMG